MERDIISQEAQNIQIWLIYKWLTVTFSFSKSCLFLVTYCSAVALHTLLLKGYRPDKVLTRHIFPYKHHASRQGFSTCWE